MNSLSRQAERILEDHTGLKQALTCWSLEAGNFFAHYENLMKEVSFHNWTRPQSIGPQVVSFFFIY